MLDRQSTFQPAGLSAFPIYRELFRALEPLSQHLQCDEERTLFCQGDWPMGVYLLRAGDALAFILNEQGRPAVEFQVYPGTVLGVPAIVSHQPYSLTVVGRRGAVIGFVSKEDFGNLIHRRPSTYIAALRMLAAEIHSARQAFTA